MVGHKAMMTSLTRRDAAYYFRQRVPVDLVARIGRRELRRSLGTSSPQQARSLVAKARARADDLFDYLRRNPMLTEDDCKFYARWWHKACLDHDWDWKQMAALLPDQAGEINADFIRNRAQTEADIIAELNSGDISRVVFEAEMALTEDGRAEDADENNADFRRLCAYMLRGALEATRKARAEETGDFTYEVRDPLFKGIEQSFIPSPAIMTPPASVPSRSLDTLIEPFINEKTGAGTSDKTLNDYRATLALFQQVVGGDRSITAITGEDVVAFKDLLRKCPNNFRKRLGTDDLREAVRLNAARPEDQRLDLLAPKTINGKYLSNLKAFFDWAKDNKHIKESPASGVRTQQPKRDAVEERDPFTIQDLNRIFAAKTFTEVALDQRGFRFWPPLISLYAGCRLNEIGQMLASDIVEIHGIPHFSIHKQAEDQRIKTAAGRRWIPVHHELVALGFLDYARRRQGGRLFPDWKLSGDGYYSSSYSKWFSRLLEGVSVKSDKKSFHSFRHSFADALHDVVIDPVAIYRFMGHESDHVSLRYGSKPPKQTWSEAFQKLAYPGLDLSSLQP